MKKLNDKVISSTLIAGAITNNISKFLTHPIDTVRAKLQVRQTPLLVRSQNKENLFSMLYRHSQSLEGIRELYRGYLITLVAGTPGGAIYYGVYEFTKQKISQLFDRRQFYVYFTAGIFAESVACVLYVPVDVIKERLQVQRDLGTYHYKGTMDAIRQILRTEGIRKFYSAYGATVSSWGPHSGFSWMFYELQKNFFFPGDIKDKKMTPFQSSFMAFISAGISALITNPLDLAKLRMQVQRVERATGINKSESLDKGRFGYKNMFHGIYLITKTEGVVSLFRGFLYKKIIYWDF